MDNGWTPVLEGELAAKAESRIAQIGAALDREDADLAQHAPPTLADGDPGIALFFAEEERLGLLPSIPRQHQWGSMLTRVLQDADDNWRTPYLYSGILGIAWALAYLGNELSLSVDLSVEELDDQLLDLCASTDMALPADLIYGLNGIGVYALERWPAEFSSRCVELLIERLAAAACRELGLAHGAAGVIAFLAAAARLNSQWRPSIRPVIEWQVHGLLRHRLPANEMGCAFPNEIGGGPSRLAWCLGDVSIAVALLAAGTAFEREDWRSMARDLAVNASARPLAFSGIVDAGLCHGAAGLAHVFNRLFQATGEERLALAARDWFSRALEMPARPVASVRLPLSAVSGQTPQMPANGIAGYSAWTYKGPSQWQWTADRGFLTGAAGIGLALMAATGRHEPTWDRVLLLSSRQSSITRAEPSD